MFEAVELGRKLSKAEYRDKVPELRERLLQVQNDLKEAGIPVYILVEGADNNSKGELVNLLGQWLDARGLRVLGFGPKTDEEARRPRFWRYWRNFPARGAISVFFGSWYTGELIKRATREQQKDEFDSHMRRIERMETMLSQDGALILKFWLHTSEKRLKKQLKELKKAHKEGWTGSRADHTVLENFKDFVRAAERAVRLTDQVEAPWFLIEAKDERYRNVTVVETLIAAAQARIEQKQQETVTASRSRRKSDRKVVTMPEPETTVLGQLDLGQTLKKDEYDHRLSELQAELVRLSWRAYHADISMILVFEGWDAAGKGGAIRRIMQAVDARVAQVISIAAPTDEEKAHHYLWRFWRHIPLAGRHTIYDRSWYGRVLVERVEGFATELEWRRAYSEINDFEEQISSRGNLLMKFWLHIDQDEQMRRFKEREKVAFKNYKITDEDWRNRSRWDDYELAAHDMVKKTGTDYAPWHLIPANDKHFARIQVLQAVCDALRHRLKNH